MLPEHWPAVREIYREGIATEMRPLKPSFRIGRNGTRLSTRNYFAGTQYTSSLMDSLSRNPRRLRIALLCSIMSG